MDPVLLIVIIIAAVVVFGVLVWAIIALIAMRQMKKMQAEVTSQFNSGGVLPGYDPKGRERGGRFPY